MEKPVGPAQARRERLRQTGRIPKAVCQSSAVRCYAGRIVRHHGTTTHAGDERTTAKKQHLSGQLRRPSRHDWKRGNERGDQPRKGQAAYGVCEGRRYSTSELQDILHAAGADALAKPSVAGFDGFAGLHIRHPASATEALNNPAWPVECTSFRLRPNA